MMGNSACFFTLSAEPARCLGGCFLCLTRAAAQYPARATCGSWLLGQVATLTFLTGGSAGCHLLQRYSYKAFHLLVLSLAEETGF